MARPTVLLFDVDGTLISCGGAGRVAMKSAFLELVGRDDVCDFPYAGSTDRAIARRGLENGGMSADEETIDHFLERYLGHLPGAVERAEGYRVFDGVRALLDQLGGRPGYALGLGTGNVEAGARTKLRRGGLAERFSFGGFGCDHEDRAELLAAGARRGAAALGEPLDACRVVVLGDTLRDVSAALAIDAECVGVGTGPCAPAELLDAGAAVAFDGLHADELRAFLGI